VSRAPADSVAVQVTLLRQRDPGRWPCVMQATALRYETVLPFCGGVLAVKAMQRARAGAPVYTSTLAARLGNSAHRQRHGGCERVDDVQLSRCQRVAAAVMFRDALTMLGRSQVGSRDRGGEVRDSRR
jgi:hypothetical protein